MLALCGDDLELNFQLLEFHRRVVDGALGIVEQIVDRSNDAAQL